MKSVFPCLLVLAGAAVFACSSSDDKPGTSSASGTDAGPQPAECSGVKALDCAQQAAHAKEAACPKFDEKTSKDNCESENCATPQGCAKALKDLGDCLLAHPVTCDAAGDVEGATPEGCQDKEAALTGCLLSQ